VKFSRVFKGELNEFVTEMYKKAPKQKQFEKNSIGIEGFNKLMKNFKSSFCYSVTRLNVLLLMKSAFITQLNVIKKNLTDESLIESFISSETNPTKKKDATIPCKLQIMTNQKRYLNPKNYLFSLVIVDSQIPIYSREMESFNQPDIQGTLELKNYFYIYPKRYFCSLSNNFIQIEVSHSSDEPIFYDPIAGNLTSNLIHC
jgi:hypothetical protein